MVMAKIGENPDTYENVKVVVVAKEAVYLHVDGKVIVYAVEQHVRFDGEQYYAELRKE
jgi:hypothetical protein